MQDWLTAIGKQAKASFICERAWFVKVKKVICARRKRVRIEGGRKGEAAFTPIIDERDEKVEEGVRIERERRRSICRLIS